MTLIVLLIVLVTERVALQSSFWQAQKYLDKYLNIALPKFNDAKNGSLSLLLLVSTPAVLTALFLHFFSNGFIYFLVSLLVLAICVGNQQARTYYRQYLNAMGRGDKEAQLLLHDNLSQLCQDRVGKTQASDDIQQDDSNESDAAKEEVDTPKETIGETLIWINFVYYAVPIFYFVLLGPAGVVLYATLLHLTKHRKSHEQDNQIDNKKLYQWLEWSFWLPSRLVSLGFMVVGHFSNGLETWLRYAADFSKSSREMLCEVATKADHLDSQPKADNAQHMVRLTKRNMILFIVFVALLTLYGRIV
ncbi:MAG: regulatory signaling modulator protein AmpE [Gammaproteobacteria bacterium]|nr:regulatory signaling modulator protein AmpE [Gammaproteobacteria bacterium]